jgi:hypothetical protein
MNMRITGDHKTPTISDHMNMHMEDMGHIMIMIMGTTTQMSLSMAIMNQMIGAYTMPMVFVPMKMLMAGLCCSQLIVLAHTMSKDSSLNKETRAWALHIRREEHMGHSKT